MSQTVATSGRRTALIVALLLGATPLVVPILTTSSVASPATVRREAAARWAGYTIPRNGRADGGWIGGYLVGGRPAFVTTPTKEPVRSVYRRSRLVSDLGGRRGATRHQTERAAWILSKYGGYRDAVQAAAVDASVYALVVGGRWSTSGDRGGSRIRETPESATVHRFARIMLGQSRRHAGEYDARVTARGADVGGTVSATVRVVDGHGRPAAGLPVQLTTSGAKAIAAVTGDDGRAVARFAESTPGWKRVTATVRNVPEHRLHLLVPTSRDQATVAEGGVRRTLVATTRAAVRGPQTLSLAAIPATVRRGNATRVRATVTGDGTRRELTGTIYGPFASTSAAKCAGATAGTRSMQVSGDGSYLLPSLVPAQPGYYVWRVAVDGTPTALPVTGCGALTTVKAVPRITLSAANRDMRPGAAAVTITLSGLPTYPSVTVTLKVLGPYSTQQAMNNAKCSGAVAVSMDQEMNGDESVPVSPYVRDPGWYSLQGTIPPAELSVSGESTCLAPNTVLHVS